MVFLPLQIGESSLVLETEREHVRKSVFVRIGEREREQREGEKREPDSAQRRHPFFSPFSFHVFYFYFFGFPFSKMYPVSRNAISRNKKKGPPFPALSVPAMSMSSSGPSPGFSFPALSSQSFPLPLFSQAQSTSFIQPKLNLKHRQKFWEGERKLL